MQLRLFSTFIGPIVGSNIVIVVLNIAIIFIIFLVLIYLLFYFYTPKKFKLNYIDSAIESAYGLDIKLEQIDNFILINSKLLKPSLAQKIMRLRPKISYSIKSTKNGLVYLISYPDYLEKNIQNNIAALCPNLKIYTINSLSDAKLNKQYYLRFNYNFISDKKSDRNLDLFSYLCNCLTIKNKNEEVVWQISTLYTPAINKNGLTKNKKLIFPIPIRLLINIMKLIQRLSSILFKILNIIFFGHVSQVDESEESLTSEIDLFTGGINLNEAESIKATILSILGSINNLSGLSFSENKKLINIVKRSKTGPLPITLVADLYNLSSFEYNLDEKANLSRNLPLPISIKNKKKIDLKVGLYDANREKISIGLTKEERLRHTYIVGGTGSGKSTLIKYAIYQDLKNNKGLALIDPHGDLAESVLDLIPNNRQNDVIYFNPVDISFPISLNLLEQNKNLTGDQKLLEQDLITEQIISIFRKLFSKDDYGGNRLEHILLNAVQTAFLIDNSTIFTVYRLLVDNKYRVDILPTIKDKTLLSFWINEYGSAGGMQRVKLSIGITSKISRFLRSTITRRILGQPSSSLNFNDILDDQKILICNLSKGLIGEDNSFILGATIIAKLQLSIYNRAKIKEAKRSPFYIYVDEFQDFATSSFLQLLSEGRKYKLGLILAEQSLSQQSKLYASNILANVGTLITFRSSSPVDEKILLPLYSPFLNNGDLLNLESYNFYIRMAATKVYPPTIAKTVLIKSNSSKNNRLIELSRENFSYNSTLVSSK